VADLYQIWHRGFISLTYSCVTDFRGLVKGCRFCGGENLPLPIDMPSCHYCGVDATAQPMVMDIFNGVD